MIVLYGAGSAGRYALKHLRERGVEVAAFADGDSAKWGMEIDGVLVHAPTAIAPGLTWVCSAISRPAASEIRENLKMMEVETKPLWECLPVFHDNPSAKVQKELIDIVADVESVLVLEDLYRFRANPDYENQRDPSPISELYFPPFISHWDDEVFVDCGACDGDSIAAFCERWPKYSFIVGIEPDPENYRKLVANCGGSNQSRWLLDHAVGDCNGAESFISTGDYSAHLSSLAEDRCNKQGKMPPRVTVRTLDYVFWGTSKEPTYIKADVEGSELELLWGARRILKEHAPALAICAYHCSEHTWQIPLLIHAINSEYRIFLRRYAEGAFELVYYAVPPERVLMPWSETSYSDNHTG